LVSAGKGILPQVARRWERRLLRIGERVVNFGLDRTLDGQPLLIVQARGYSGHLVAVQPGASLLAGSIAEVEIVPRTHMLLPAIGGTFDEARPLATSDRSHGLLGRAEDAKHIVICKLLRWYAER